MGQSMSAAREAQKEAAEKERQEAMEKLAALEKMALAQLESKKELILHGTNDDEEIHKGIVVSRHQQVRVDVTSTVADSVKDAISDFFDGDVLDGIKNLVFAGVNELLGNTAVGENESEDMLIIWENNTLVRIDVYYWKWNFSSKDIMKVSESVFASYFVKRVLSLKEVEPDVLIYAITQMCRKRQPMLTDEEALAFINKIMEKIKEAREKIIEDESASATASGD